MSDVKTAYKKFETIVAKGVFIASVGPAGVTVTDVDTFYAWDAKLCERHFSELLDGDDVETYCSVKDMLNNDVDESEELDGKLTFNEMNFEHEDWSTDHEGD